MDLEELQRLHSIAKEIDLEGKALQDFLREERTAFREKQYEERQNKERELELERQNKERELEFQRQEKERELERQERERERQHELELAKIRAETSFVNQSDAAETNATQVVQSQVKAAKLTLFDEEVDSIDAYLSRLEYHEAVKSEKGNWAIYLAALLKGKGHEVYSLQSSKPFSCTHVKLSLW